MNGQAPEPGLALSLTLVLALRGMLREQAQSTAPLVYGCVRAIELCFRAILGCQEVLRMHVVDRHWTDMLTQKRILLV